MDKQQPNQNNTRTERPKQYKPKWHKPRTDKTEDEKSSVARPKTEDQKTDRPKYDRPKTEGQKTDRPKYDRPKTEGQKTDRPKYDRPKTEGQKTDRPKYDRPKTEGEKVDKPRYERPKTDKPRYDRPRQPKRFEEVAEVADVEVNEGLLFGRNAVIEVLKSGRDIDKILIQKGQVEGSIKKIIGEAKAKGIVMIETEKAKLDEITAHDKHQGVVAYVSAHKYAEVDEILNDAKSKGEDPFILILDNIQDPHNLGAIIRTAHTAGVHGIIIAKRRAVGLTATVAKASAGAIEYMKVAKVTNIAQTIEDLKAKGIWIACADMGGEIIYKDNLRGAIGIVIGSEGEGISTLVKSKCDFAVSIPMYGKVTSLNASVAASILVYEVVRQRHF